MTESSYFWQGSVTGDASIAPYSADDHRILLKTLFNSPYNYYYVIAGYLNELNVTNTSGSTFQVDTGAALVDGTYYRNTTPLSLNLGADGWYWIALEKDWAAQTIRAVVLGPNAGSPVALTQTVGVKWQVALLKINKSGGVISSTEDVRAFIHPPNYGLNVKHHLLGIESLGGKVDGISPVAPLFPVRAIFGTVTWTGVAADNGSVSVNFPATIVFLNRPAIVATAKSNSGRINVAVSSTKTAVSLYWYAHPPNTYTSVTIMWAAVGQVPVGSYSFW